MARRKKKKIDVCAMAQRSANLIAVGINEGAYDRIVSPRSADATLKMLEDYVAQHCPRKRR